MPCRAVSSPILLHYLVFNTCSISEEIIKNSFYLVPISWNKFSDLDCGVKHLKTFSDDFLLLRSIHGLFFLYFRLLFTVIRKQMFLKKLPVARFEPRSSGVRCDHSSNDKSQNSNKSTIILCVCCKYVLLASS